MRGGAVWQLVGLITRRSQVQILSPLPKFWLGPIWGFLFLGVMDYLEKSLEQQLFNSVESLGYELMDLELSPQKNGLKITVFIDHDNGIDIDDCVNTTKEISPIFEDDESDKSYIIEVSSPGLDRKLINKEHFDKFIGKTIKIKLKNKLLDRKNFKGQLLNRVKNTITINDHDDKEIEIDIKLIDICRIVPVFK